MTRAKTYVSGSDTGVLTAFYVSSINEWRIRQERVLVLTKTAYYRTTYDPKKGKIDHYHKTPLDEVRAIEKTANGVKIYLTKQDGRKSVAKMFGGMIKKAKDIAPNEFEHSREYLPIKLIQGATQDLLLDAMAGIFHKAAELHCASMSCEPPNLITTNERRQILADRKEAEKLEKERIEREAASEELKMAMAAAKDSRVVDGLIKPLKRAKKAVEVEPKLLDDGEKLKLELEEEKRERELQERLEAERVEREAATEELEAAIAAATESRDATGLSKPIKRAKKAVDLSPELITKGAELKKTLEEELKEKLRKEAEEKRLEEEKVEREAATDELKAAIETAKGSRDASVLSKPLKRAKKAIEVDPQLLDDGAKLKYELEEEKKEKERVEKEEAERVERENATEELKSAIESARSNGGGLSKPIKRAKQAVGVSTDLIEQAEALKKQINDEKKEAEREAKEAKKSSAADDDD